MNVNWLGIFLILSGLLAMVGSALNWRIVTRSGKLINRLLGNGAARVIYFVVGVGLFILGIGQLIGANWIP